MFKQTVQQSVHASTAAVEAIPVHAPVGGVVGDELSLVIVEQTAQLVTWTNVAERKGRFVKVDAKNRAVWVIPGLHPVQDLRDCIIIRRTIGVRLFRMKGRDRPLIPDHIIRLMRFINHSENLMPCVVCLTDSTNAKEGALFVCHWCVAAFPHRMFGAFEGRGVPARCAQWYHNQKMVG